MACQMGLFEEPIQTKGERTKVRHPHKLMGTMALVFWDWILGSLNASGRGLAVASNNWCLFSPFRALGPVNFSAVLSSVYMTGQAKIAFHLWDRARHFWRPGWPWTWRWSQLHLLHPQQTPSTSWESSWFYNRKESVWICCNVISGEIILFKISWLFFLIFIDFPKQVNSQNWQSGINAWEKARMKFLWCSCARMRAAWFAMLCAAEAETHLCMWHLVQVEWIFSASLFTCVLPVFVQVSTFLRWLCFGIAR